jgi:hypothetical protein
MGMQVAYNPKVLLPFSHLGETDEMRVQDASCLAARDERLSFWELQVGSLVSACGTCWAYPRCRAAGRQMLTCQRHIPRLMVARHAV